MVIKKIEILLNYYSIEDCLIDQRMDVSELEQIRRFVP
jgi:hypothetical protein